jgi:glycosyltransferase involved in cell wall biosynthesis
LINSQITSAPPNTNKWSTDYILDKFNFYYSKIILSNSKAGISSYAPPLKKSRIIYNGVNMDRFINLPDKQKIKEKYGIKTPYAVVMSASFSPNKDYDLFIKIAELVTHKRDEITFFGVGGYSESEKYIQLEEKTRWNPKIIIHKKINDVEALVNACDIGVLFSNTSVHGEGISNSILEYMALEKPVIANDAGGTREIIRNNESGYLVKDQSAEEIADLILELVDDENKRNYFGQTGKKIIQELFLIEKMGQAFEKAYYDSLG